MISNLVRDAHDVTVIVVRSGLNYPRSNPGRGWIKLFSIQPWINSRAYWFFKLYIKTCLGKIQTGRRMRSTRLKRHNMSSASTTKPGYSLLTLVRLFHVKVRLTIIVSVLRYLHSYLELINTCHSVVISSFK